MAEPGLLDSLKHIFAEGQEVLAARIRLTLLEAQYAALSLVMMIVAGVMAGGLLLAAWLAALAVVVLLLGEFSPLNLPMALLAVCVFNIGVFFMVMRWIRQRSVALLFPLSRGDLHRKDKPSAPPVAA